MITMTVSAAAQHAAAIDDIVFDLMWVLTLIEVLLRNLIIITKVNRGPS